MAIIMRGLTGLVLAAAVLSSGRVLADRSPTPDERSRIETFLRGQGFARWGEIELDDGVWEVDDAHAPDGRKYDLELDRDTLTIVKREAD